MFVGFWFAAACSDYGFKPGNDVTDTLPEDTATRDTDTTTRPPKTEEVTDRFVLEGTTKTDIIVFGDTSGSMAVELATLGAKIQEFLDYLDSQSNDWQILSVNAPDACGATGILTRDTPDYAATFAAGIVIPPTLQVLNEYGGEPMEPDEWGLFSVAAAAEHSLPGGCNEGLLRNGALLHAIVISDEDDVSPGHGTDNYWKQYVDRLVAAKADAKTSGSVKISAIAGPVPSGCKDADSQADPGLGYDEAVPFTGGEFVSICDDWPTHLEDLAAASIGNDQFPLTQIPIVDTIEVSVNEVLRPSGWSYVEAGNYVHFTADPPTTSDSVQITYEVAL